MNLWDLITGKDYIGLVKQFIEKVFVHEAAKYACNKDDISIILIHGKDENDIRIMTYSRTDDKPLRYIPDKEAQEILMK